MASAARPWEATTATSSWAPARSAGTDAGLHGGGELLVLGGAGLGDGSVGLRLTGAVGRSVAARRDELGVDDPGSRRSERDGEDGSDRQDDL